MRSVCATVLCRERRTASSPRYEYGEALSENIEHHHCGYDMEIANWRGILGSPNMPEANYQEWVDRFAKLNDSKEWGEVLKTQGWEQYFLAGPEFADFIKAESDRINTILKDAGLTQ